MTLEVVSLSLGAYQTNCFVVTAQGSTAAVVIDPGDEAGRIVEVLAERGLTLVAILVTHGHLDHIGAVRDLAAATGVEVWMARGDADDLRSFEPAPYDPEHVVGGGDTVSVAFVGDVLFAGSIGRSDLAGGDLDTLIESITLLMRELPPETVVAPGHGPATTLEHELASNPFLEPLR